MKTHPDFDELSAEAQGRVDDVCDALEAAWQKVVTRTGTGHGTSAGWPEIDSFVENFLGHERVAALRELVPIDVSYRRQCGAPRSGCGAETRVAWSDHQRSWPVRSARRRFRSLRIGKAHSAEMLSRDN